MLKLQFYSAWTNKAKTKMRITFYIVGSQFHELFMNDLG